MVVHARHPALLLGSVDHHWQLHAMKVFDETAELMSQNPIMVADQEQTRIAWQLKALTVKCSKIGLFMKVDRAFSLPFAFCQTMAFVKSDCLAVCKDDRIWIINMMGKTLVCLRLALDLAFPFNLTAVIQPTRASGCLSLVVDSAQFSYPHLIVKSSWLSILRRSAKATASRQITLRSSLDNGTIDSSVRKFASLLLPRQHPPTLVQLAANFYRLAVNRLQLISTADFNASITSNTVITSLISNKFSFGECQPGIFVLATDRTLFVINTGD